MKIETKYEIGTHIWVVNEMGGEVSVYDDYIVDIIIEKDGLRYGLKEGCDDKKEDEIILYKEKERLYDVICEKMRDIRESEEKNNG